MRHVRFLARTIGVRTKTSRNERRAARYVADKMSSFGYEAKIQKFQVNGRTSRNVVARWPGAARYPFVVGAHIDSVPGSPGANDNASGTAVIVELARIFAGKPQAHWVTFVGFGAEEYDSAGTTHHNGSKTFVARLGDRGRTRLAGMISVDMVADGRPLLIGNSAISGRHKVANSLYNTARKRNIAARRITLCDCSDHGPFEHAGIDAGFTYSGSEPDYHSPSDVPANLQPRDLVRSGRAIRYYVRKLDKRFIAWLRAS
jgi:Zn-dependent M28 family amino/carboxypeptidase